MQDEPEERAARLSAIRQVADRGDDVEVADAQAGEEDGEEGDEQPGRGGHEKRGAFGVERDGQIIVEQVGEGRRRPVEAPDQDGGDPQAHQRPDQGREQAVGVALVDEETHQSGALEGDGAQDAKLPLTLLGEHRVDVDDQEYPREDGEGADHEKDVPDLKPSPLQRVLLYLRDLELSLTGPLFRQDLLQRPRDLPGPLDPLRHFPLVADEDGVDALLGSQEPARIFLTE